MSEKADELFERIHKVRDARKNSGCTPEQLSTYKTEEFIEKYGYSLDELCSLLNELSEYGYIKIYNGLSGFRLLD